MGKGLLTTKRNGGMLVSMDRDYLIDLIAAERERLLLSESELARRAGITRQAVHSLLRRKFRGLPTIRACLRALNLMKEEDIA